MQSVPVSMKLRFVQGRYAVARLSADSQVPDWVSGPGFMAIVRADDELTIVCSDDQVPADVEAERGWVCFRTFGPIPFQATGVVKSLIDPLSSSGIGVFVVCTFDGENLLVSERDRSKTVNLLIESGHYFIK